MRELGATASQLFCDIDEASEADLEAAASRPGLERLTEHQISQPLSRPRHCWDNAVAESFFASLELELIDRHSWATRAQVRALVFDYIERLYNRRRLHPSLDYLTPVEYEARIHHHKAAHAA
jgi:transposase InsO family protein